MKERRRFKMKLPRENPGALKAWRTALRVELDQLLRADALFEFPHDARLAIKARVDLPKSTWHEIDVDNTLKVLMDALQGGRPVRPHAQSAESWVET